MPCVNTYNRHVILVCASRLLTSSKFAQAALQAIKAYEVHFPSRASEVEAITAAVMDDRNLRQKQVERRRGLARELRAGRRKARARIQQAYQNRVQGLHTAAGTPAPDAAPGMVFAACRLSSFAHV